MAEEVRGRLIDHLIEKSVFILRESTAQFKNLCMLWSTGKDSTATLDLCRRAFFGKVPYPVLHIDTGWKFPEMYEFRDKIAKEWGLDLRVVRSPKAGILAPDKVSHKDCCHTLKTTALKDYIEREGFDAVIVSIRRDEHYMRAAERIFSPRDKDWRWKHYRPRDKKESGDSPFVYQQDTQIWDIHSSDYLEMGASHVRVHPILHWTEREVWLYIRERGLPVNPLYYSNNGKRYRSLGCAPCTNPIDSNAKTIDEIVDELAVTKTRERAGRAQDKDKEQIMRHLRSLGYM